MESQDQEVTLGTGRLLGLFFGLVIVCALFFSLGFSLGRRFSTDAAATRTTSSTLAASAEPKPSPARADSANQTEPETTQKASTDELTFYKAVERNQENARLDPPAPAVHATTRTVSSRAAPENRRMPSAASGYMVQVAAVTKQEDADALVKALRRKNYPVIAAGAPSDKLYHVQVGPFADLKDAERVRTKLIGDGYNPILKK